MAFGLRRSLARLTRPPLPTSLPVPELGVHLAVRPSNRARRLLLRLLAPEDRVELVAPTGVDPALLQPFVQRNLGWIRQRLSGLPPRIAFTDGALVPLAGVPHRLRHDTEHRGGPLPWVGPHGPELVVGGRIEFLGRRVADYLKQHARKTLSERAQAKAAPLGRRITAVTVRDPRGRWGSCSSTGRLSFSWRLILAPDWVLDYVVAHEVAHLVEMNHSSRFWSLCNRLTGQGPAARHWLQANGAALHRYGPNAAAPTD